VYLSEAQIALIAGYAVLLGMLISTLILGNPQPLPTPVSANCAVQFVPLHQDATVLANGDAGWLWLPGANSLKEFVCTDGTLIHVTGYGN